MLRCVMQCHVRSLRKDLTSAERLLWSRLRRRQLAGFKFRRQHQIGLYICDFASLDGSIIVELDGSQHVDRKTYDGRRDGFLRSAGFRVLRFWNDDVLARTDQVVETIYAALQCPEMDGRFD
jgi:very-short-patch-repair endonuclease